jgi:transcriptional regulator with XRE-family HTH domain
VSQHKSLTNFDKGNFLKIARDRLELRLAQMAKEISLDPLYLGQLENSQREVDEYFIRRAEELVRAFEKPN